MVLDHWMLAFSHVFSNKEQASCGFKPLSWVVQFPQVLCLTGEGVTLKVPSSIMAHELRRMVLEKLPTKKGAKLVLHHLHSKLLLGQSLQEQGILGETATLSCTYDPWKRKVFFCFFQCVLHVVQKHVESTCECCSKNPRIH